MPPVKCITFDMNLFAMKRFEPELHLLVEHVGVACDRVPRYVARTLVSSTGAVSALTHELRALVTPVSLWAGILADLPRYKLAAGPCSTRALRIWNVEACSLGGLSVTDAYRSVRRLPDFGLLAVYPDVEHGAVLLRHGLHVTLLRRNGDHFILVFANQLLVGHVVGEALVLGGRLASLGRHSVLLRYHHNPA